VKISDDWNYDAALSEPVYDMWNRSRGLFSVHSHAHQLRTGACELFHLQGGAFDVHRVGVGHRLDDNWVVAADFYAVYVDRY
jgi:hypothetical protein